MTNTPAHPSSDHSSRRGWRVALGAAALVSIVGGSMHPDAPDGLSIREDLVAMMDSGAWVTGHSLLAAGTALLLVGLVLARRGGALPEAADLLPFAIGATAAYLVEGLFHTAAIVDQDAFATGGWPPIVTTHLVLSLLVYPVFGAAVALLAWRLLPRWPLPLRPFAVLGMAAGVANGIAAPLTVIFQDTGFTVLFPIGAIGTWAFVLVAALAGLRQRGAALGLARAAA